MGDCSDGSMEDDGFEEQKRRGFQNRGVTRATPGLDSALMEQLKTGFGCTTVSADDMVEGGVVGGEGEGSTGVRVDDVSKGGEGVGVGLGTVKSKSDNLGLSNKDKGKGGGKLLRGLQRL